MGVVHFNSVWNFCITSNEKIEWNLPPIIFGVQLHLQYWTSVKRIQSWRLAVGYRLAIRFSEANSNFIIGPLNIKDYEYDNGITSRHLGWKNQDKPQKSHFNLKFSIFSKSFQMFPEGMESVWGCSLGLKTHFTWYQAIFKAFFEKKLKVETCLREAFCMSKTGFACKNAFSSRKIRIF